MSPYSHFHTLQAADSSWFIDPHTPGTSLPASYRSSIVRLFSTCCPETSIDLDSSDPNRQCVLLRATSVAILLWQTITLHGRLWHNLNLTVSCSNSWATPSRWYPWPPFYLKPSVFYFCLSQPSKLSTVTSLELSIVYIWWRLVMDAIKKAILVTAKCIPSVHAKPASQTWCAQPLTYISFWLEQ